MKGNRRFFFVSLAVCLVIAGFVSFYASSFPDGLGYVAQQTGFADAAEESAAAGSPLAGYTTSGVANDRLSTAIAGVVGSLLVLALAGGVFLLVGRRRQRVAGTAAPTTDPRET